MPTDGNVPASGGTYWDHGFRLSEHRGNDDPRSDGHLPRIQKGHLGFRPPGPSGRGDDRLTGPFLGVGQVSFCRGTDVQLRGCGARGLDWCAREAGDQYLCREGALESWPYVDCGDRR